MFWEEEWVVEVFAILLVIILVIIILKYAFRRKPKSIRGKVVLVTGGGNGLGRELCIKLSQQGCKVAIADIDFDGCLKTIEMMDKVDSKAYKIDLLQTEDIDSLKEQVLKDFGTIDILLNNAGIISFSTIFHESANLIRSIIGVNLIAPILLTRAIMPLMIKQKSGHIVTISSASGIYPVADANTYGASKFGVSGFMMGLRELIRRKKLDKVIFTTTVYPMPIATNDDVLKIVNEDKLELLKTDKVARQIVQAVLMNKHEISMPTNLHKRIRQFMTAPMWLQILLRKNRGEKAHFNCPGIDEIC